MPTHKIEICHIELKNCYGIGSFDEKFSFPKNSNNNYCIYASNGVMKTSFTKSLLNYSKGEPQMDECRPYLESSCEIVDQNGKPIAAQSILAIESLNPDFTSDKASTLLADAGLRKRYDAIFSELEEAMDALSASLKKESKIDLRKELRAIAIGNENEFEVLTKLKTYVNSPINTILSEMPYATIFDASTESLVKRPDFVRSLNEYINTLKKISKDSPLFKDGVFDNYKAGEVLRNLKQNDYFKANHGLLIAQNTKKETKITTDAELQKIIEDEQNKILKNKQLREKFNAIEKNINKNVNSRKFKEYIVKNSAILPEFVDYNKLRRKVLAEKIKSHKSEYEMLISNWKSAKNELERIAAQAERQSTEWKRVIGEFQTRFPAFPLTVKVKNQKDVILNRAIPVFDFTYRDGRGEVSVAEDVIQRFLSNGEKRALYLLNILYEIKARIKNKTETIIVFDDIADSFDYQNKYAIIEYLKEIAEIDFLHVIILTHNFDFFRAVESRGVVPYKSCLIASKTGKDEVVLSEVKGVNNMLTEIKGDKTSKEAFVAMIPFCRNLIEFSDSVQDSDYLVLTSALHIKPDSKTTVKDIKDILERRCKYRTSISHDAEPIIDFTKRAAREVASNSNRNDFKAKLLLALAARLNAEEFMIRMVNNPSDTNGISGNQTGKLYEMVKKLDSVNEEARDILNRVMITTPETIHINAFMYEPLIDISIESIRATYKETLKLAGI